MEVIKTHPILLVVSIFSVGLLFASQAHSKVVWHYRPSVSGVATGVVFPLAVLTSAVLIGSSARRAYLRLFSPAKINEFLKVLRPAREDGFHNLISVFQAVSLGDSIRMDVAPEGRDYDLLVCDNPAVPTDSSNLVCKALEEFRKTTGIQKFFNVELKKQIPMGAGLGGGSSNAATVLFGANKLVGGGLTGEELARIGARIGSDVAFFLASEGRALCQSRGEVVVNMQPEANTGDTDLLILALSPTVHCATGPVFKHFAQQSAGHAAENEHVSLNDLEAAAFGLHPELAQMKDFLITHGVKHVTMSGSGSSFYGFVAKEKLSDLECSMQTLFPSASVVRVRRISKDADSLWFS